MKRLSTQRLTYYGGPPPMMMMYYGGLTSSTRRGRAWNWIKRRWYFVQRVTSFNMWELVFQGQKKRAYQDRLVLSRRQFAVPTKDIVHWSGEEIPAWKVESPAAMFMLVQTELGPRRTGEEGAACSFGCTAVPGMRCASPWGDGCGFYAYKTLKQAINHRGMSDHFGPGLSVFPVLLYGTVLEYTEGYRAQHWRIDPDVDRQLEIFNVETARAEEMRAITMRRFTI